MENYIGLSDNPIKTTSLNNKHQMFVAETGKEGKTKEVVQDREVKQSCV